MNKMVYKLIGYFTAALLLFSIINGCVFYYLFNKNTTEIHKNNLYEKAVTIADSLSFYFDNQTDKVHGQGNIKSYMKVIDDIAMADVWVVDKSQSVISRGRGNSDVAFNQLPQDAEVVIKKALGGQTAFSESFSQFLNVNTLTVGVPVKISNGAIAGAVLIHSPIENISTASKDGLNILLFSLICALIISILLGIVLSINFTKPIKRMKTVAQGISKGDYKIKTQIYQKDEIGELANSLDVMSKQLEISSVQSMQLEKMRRDFISNISHELRTPVTVIRGSLEALCDGVVSGQDKVNEYHKQMLGESIHLQRLVNDLLDLTRLQNTDFVINMEKVNLSDVVSDVARSMKQIATSKNVELTISNNLAQFDVLGDYSRLRQMLIIIVDNAIKFSQESMNVEIKGEIINQSTAQIKVIDNGCGIEQSEMPFIFDRFHKTNSQENKSGTGLGLAIAKQIADRHNVKISASSEKGKGSCFVFEFYEYKQKRQD